MKSIMEGLVLFWEFLRLENSLQKVSIHGLQFTVLSEGQNKEFLLMLITKEMFHTDLVSFLQWNTFKYESKYTFFHLLLDPYVDCFENLPYQVFDDLLTASLRLVEFRDKFFNKWLQFRYILIDFFDQHLE